MRKFDLMIDIGNTHIVMGLYEKGVMSFLWRLNSNKNKTEDEYYVFLNELFKSREISINEIRRCAVSSVVPKLSRVFNHLIEKYISVKTVFVDGFTDLGLQISADPATVGSDLIVNAYSAWKKYKKNTIVCDLGTATTIQLTGDDGRFYGTIISPGVVNSAENLFSTASLLSNIQLKQPPVLLGTNTEEALLSGIVSGNAFMVDSFIKKIKDNYKQMQDVITIATGGISTLIAEQSTQIDVVDKTLTLDGLSLICDKLLT